MRPSYREGSRQGCFAITEPLGSFLEPLTPEDPEKLAMAFAES